MPIPICLQLLSCSYEELFKPGVHYEPVRYDLTNLVARGQELLAKFNGSGTATNSSAAMQRMAAAAASKALETFSLLGQLDVLAYAAQKVRSHPMANISCCFCFCE
jgi:hypothetical protein